MLDGSIFNVLCEIHIISDLWAEYSIMWDGFLLATPRAVTAEAPEQHLSYAQFLQSPAMEACNSFRIIIVFC